MPGSIVITGASSGIGMAIATDLAESGFKVFAGVRNTNDGDALREEASGDLTPLQIDVTHPDLIFRAVETVTLQVGAAGLSGLVNNAGIVVASPMEAVTAAALREQFEVNVLGTVSITQAFLPLLREGRGRIINMSSISGLLAFPLLGPYAASKFALEAISDALRMELHEWGIHVALIEPGTIATPLWKKSDALADELMEKLPEHTRNMYESLYTNVQKAMLRAAKRAIPAKRVARVVAAALTCKRPKARYRVGWDARLVHRLLRPLPVWIRDRLILTDING